MSEPNTTFPRLRSMYYAIEAIEIRLDSCPGASVTPLLRAALGRLLAFPSYPHELPESYEPGYRAALAESEAYTDRNMWVMENFLLTFVGDCLSRPMPDPAWIEALYEALLAHLRLWLGAYARETRPEELPVDLEAWSLCRLIAAYQRAYEVAPADPAYRLLTPTELAHRSASLA